MDENSTASQDDAPAADNEFVQKGSRGITEVFMPHFWKELRQLEPNERAQAWVGFLSAGLGQMAADQGLEMTRAMVDGVLEGVEETIKAQQGAPKASPLVLSLIERSKRW